jgi:hypothetical protein
LDKTVEPTGIHNEGVTTMNKLFISFMSMLMILAVPAGQVRADEFSVRSAINELQYSLSVEWDQHSEAVKNEIVNRFANKIEDMRKAGMTNEQLLESVASETGNPQSAKDLKALADYANQNNLSADQINEVVAKYVSASQKTGAHWNGSGGYYQQGYGTGGYSNVGRIIGIIIIVIVIIAVVMAIRNQQNNNNNNDHQHGH